MRLTCSCVTYTHSARKSDGKKALKKKLQVIFFSPAKRLTKIFLHQNNFAYRTVRKKCLEKENEVDFSFAPFVLV